MSIEDPLRFLNSRLCVLIWVVGEGLGVNGMFLNISTINTSVLSMKTHILI